VEDTAWIIAIWVHILGIALLVGPQFFLAFAWVPVARTIADQRVRVDLTRRITRRFGYLAGAGLVLIVIAGSYLISAWRDHYKIDEDLGFTEYRYGVIFIVKMGLLIAMLAVLAVHSFLVGPRLIDAMDRELNGAGSAEDVRRYRMASMTVSIVGLLLALAIMVLGVMMNTTTFSHEDT
jgi:uncharacterized membrane protein